jgi:hypothetical protein
MPFRDQAAERRGPDAPLEVELGAQSTSQLYADLGGNLLGVFASTFLVLAPEAHVHLILSFPDRRSIRAAGLVQFVRAAGPDQLPGLGIAFTELAAEDRAIITHFAEHVRPPMLYEA